MLQLRYLGILLQTQMYLPNIIQFNLYKVINIQKIKKYFFFLQ